MIKERLKARARCCFNAIKNDKQFYGFALLAVAIAALFVCIVHNRMLPFAEGWYTYYAKCINEGLFPYRDFEYLYPPVYIYFIALFTRIFGYELIMLRRLGIFFFALIALGLYLSVTVIVGKKRSYIALIAAVTGVFYLQSEVVQIFYDYVRLMDIVTVFLLYNLLKAVKGMVSGERYRKSLIWCGILHALLLHIKQNFGLIFLVYSLVLVVYIGLWCRRNGRVIVKDVLLLLLPVAVLEVAVLAALLFSGSLAAYFAMTGANAAGAKGGILALLFGWVINNKMGFLYGLPAALAFLGVIVGAHLIYRLVLAKKETGEEAPAEVEDTHRRVGAYISLAFVVLVLAGLLLLMLSAAFAKAILPTYYFSTYSVFLVVFPIFVACGVWGIVDMVHRRDTMRDEVLLFTLAGAYFAVSFACGNSGGLADGQASFGIAFLVTAIMLLCERYMRYFYRIAACQIGGNATRAVAAVLCLLLVMQCAGKKMVYTYNWWGMDESSYWESTETTDLPLLDGIKLSPETKAVYEGICHAIMENTDAEDPIYCFPQIPLIYNICDRDDPGVFAKVQWFDVASDAAVLSDIEVLKQNPPKAIVIYNTSDHAYTSHENAFRGGNESGTRAMREFLYNYVADNGYKYYGTFEANSNTLSLWIVDESGETPCVNFAGGTGTAEDPYLVADAAQLRMLSQMVEAGRTFHGQYICLAADIDMSGYSYTPVDEEGSRFSGTFDTAGYTLSNVPE